MFSAQSVAIPDEPLFDDFTVTHPMDFDAGPGTSGAQYLNLPTYLVVNNVIAHPVRESTPPSVTQTVGPPDDPRIHEFITEYHPNSGRAPEKQPFGEHSRKRQLFSRHPKLNAEPWRPFFRTREDFVFSEVLMEAGMNKDQTERLITVFRLCLDGKGSFTLSNYSDIRGAWDRASSQLTAVSLGTILKFNH